LNQLIIIIIIIIILFKVLDQWHPLEKAQYPDYFAKRVELKKEYITWYVRKYGIDTYRSEIEGHVSLHDDHGHH
jgi:hypothetical protein